MGGIRITEVPGPVFSEALYLIGQAWLKRDAGDVDGAAAELSAAMELIPLEAIEMVLFRIEAGEMPRPAPGPAMDAWHEECRQAGSGEFRLTLGYRTASPPSGQESPAEFLSRLARDRAEAERRMAAGELADPEPEAKPPSLADELRAMGLM